MDKIKKFLNFIAKARWGVCSLLAGSSIFGAGSAFAAEQSPNIIFILADDLGWTDIACNGDGNEYDSTYYQTPNIASLRADGMRFTNAYAACPTCRPTRASIMTGKYPKRLSIHNLFNWLPLCETTIAEALDQGGTDYVSATVGKWDLNKGYSPTEQGFDYNYGGSHIKAPKGGNGHFELDDNGGWDPNYYPNLGNDINDQNEYLADSLTDKALEFMETTTDPNNPNYEKPYFLYLPHYSVHTPIQPKDINDANGWTPSEHHDNKKYAAMIKNLDDNIGRIINALNSDHNDYIDGLDPNTIVIFFSDNGGQIDIVDGNQVTSNYPLNEGKGELYEGGIRVPMIVKWPGVVDANSTCNTSVSSIDFFPTILQIAYPDTFDATNYPVIDGVSIVPLLEDPNTNLDRNELYFDKCETPTTTAVAVRSGDDKLIYSSSYEFYDLANDINETNNLYTDDPCDPNYEKSQELKGLLDDWIDSFKPYRKSDSETFGKIQDAIDDANTNPGETIIVPPAILRGSVTINKDITITSKDPNDPAIVAGTVLCASGVTTTVTFDPNVSDSHLSGITITHDGISTVIGKGGVGCQSESSSSVTLSRCVIRDNTNYFNGGGIYNFAGTISNCVVMNNHTRGYGGGLSDCNGVIKNSIIANNTADANEGGGLYNCDGTIINCTIASNIADNGGGLSDCNAEISNCIIWGNEPNQLAGCSDPNYSCIQDWTSGGTDNITSDPCFVDADSNDFHLDPNSLCIDAGDPNGDYEGEFDIDNRWRVWPNDSNEIDIGADEEDCFPSDHNDYDDWVSVDKPDCWCYPRQCHGDADGEKEGSVITGYAYVSPKDLDVLVDGWMIKEPPDGNGIASIPNGICADFDHALEGSELTGYARVSPKDLDILTEYWMIKEPTRGPGVPPDCLD